MVNRWKRDRDKRKRIKASIPKRVIKRDVLCQCEGCDRCYPAEGPCLRDATEADHLNPISEGGDLEDMEGMVGKCSPCHLLKSQKEAARGSQRRSRRARFQDAPHPGLL